MEFYAVVLILVLVPYCQGITWHSEIKECMDRWGRLKQGKMTDMEEHCFRMKTMTNCFTRPASGAGPLLDHGRLYAFEETVFLNKYGVCKPAVDLAALRKFLDNSGLREKYQSIIIDNDDPDPCAGDVHKTCLSQYSKLYRNGKMCADHLTYMKCIRNEAKKASCDAPIMKHFIQINEVVGKRLVFEMENQIPEECQSM